MIPNSGFSSLMLVSSKSLWSRRRDGNITAEIVYIKVKQKQSRAITFTTFHKTILVLSFFKTRYNKP